MAKKKRKRLADYMREQGIDPVASATFAPPVQVPQGGRSFEPLDEGHPEMGVDRYVVMNLATTPETGKRYLEKKGWEVEHLGGWDFAVRKPGEETWYRMDPKGFDLGDLGDIGGDIATGIGAGIGMGGGFAAGSATGPGALATAAAGGAGGAAAVEGGKIALGKMLGLDPTLGEAAQGIGAEAALGAAFR